MHHWFRGTMEVVDPAIVDIEASFSLQFWVESDCKEDNGSLMQEVNSILQCHEVVIHVTVIPDCFLSETQHHTQKRVRLVNLHNSRDYFIDTFSVVTRSGHVKYKKNSLACKIHGNSAWNNYLCQSLVLSILASIDQKGFQHLLFITIYSENALPGQAINYGRLLYFLVKLV